jgi:hypothetical protein
VVWWWFWQSGSDGVVRWFHGGSEFRRWFCHSVRRCWVLVLLFWLCCSVCVWWCFSLACRWFFGWYFGRALGTGVVVFQMRSSLVVVAGSTGGGCLGSWCWKSGLLLIVALSGFLLFRRVRMIVSHCRGWTEVVFVVLFKWLMCFHHFVFRCMFPTIPYTFC